MHTRSILWKFVCDLCNAEATTINAYGAAMKRPAGWGWECVYSKEHTTFNLPIMKDFCPACVEKQQIREVFK